MTMYDVNETHDARARSWVASANEPATDFPLQNLPLCVFDYEECEGARVGVGIGDHILDLGQAAEEELFEDDEIEDALLDPALNAIMELPLRKRAKLRRTLFEWLRDDSPLQPALDSMLVPMGSASLLLPCEIGDYTDFYASVFHATNVGSMFRPDSPLLPNYKWVPIAYHGRASSIVPSGTAVRRPCGQLRDNATAPPRFAPSERVDYELEVGFYIGLGNTIGERIAIDAAERHIFGLSLVNDWSARDIQTWEYQPLGPFLAKSFATTVSPWVVTMEALAPFRVHSFIRPEDDPQPLPYLSSETDRGHGAVDLTLEVYLSSRTMRDRGMPAVRLSRGRFRDMYWTLAQMVTHHASNGCNLRTADLLASGTVSGIGKDERGSLLELTWRGAEPMQLPSGESRAFLQDGDEVTMRGYCERNGFRRIGFGECRGVIEPA